MQCCPAGQEGECFFILIEKIKSLTWCHCFWMTSPLLLTLSQLPLNAAAREDTRRRAREESSEGGGEEEKKQKTRKTISITQEKESLVGVIWLIMLNGDWEGGGEIGPREQISRHSWGRTLFGRVSKAHNTAFLLHASANSNWNSVSCHTSFRSVPPPLFFFFSLSF